MAHQQWPAALTTRLKHGSTIEFQDNQLTFEPDVGPAITRRRSTLSLKRFQVTLPLQEARGEPQTFADFYENTLQGGALGFCGLRDPLGVARCFRIADAPSLTEVQNGYWEVSLSLEEIPT